VGGSGVVASYHMEHRLHGIRWSIPILKAGGSELVASAGASLYSKLEGRSWWHRIAGAGASLYSHGASTEWHPLEHPCTQSWSIDRTASAGASLYSKLEGRSWWHRIASLEHPCTLSWRVGGGVFGFLGALAYV
jgi:hypothetical protein